MRHERRGVLHRIEAEKIKRQGQHVTRFKGLGEMSALCSCVKRPWRRIPAGWCS
jgi:DNA gyrase/topoisomerase IV subunit B